MQPDKWPHDVFYLVAEGRRDMTKVKGMSVREVSEALDVSERTVFRMISDGRLTGRKIRFPNNTWTWRKERKYEDLRCCRVK